MARKKYSETVSAVEDMETAPVNDETPAERFTRLANYRLRKTIERMRMLRNLAGPSYEYTQEQAEKMIAALRAEVDVLETLFGDDEDDIPQL